MQLTKVLAIYSCHIGAMAKVHNSLRTQLAIVWPRLSSIIALKLLLVQVLIAVGTHRQLRFLFNQLAGHEIGRAARRERQDHHHRPVRIGACVLRGGGRGEQECAAGAAVIAFVKRRRDAMGRSVPQCGFRAAIMTPVLPIARALLGPMESV
jgi:hypothetical protein